MDKPVRLTSKETTHAGPQYLAYFVVCLTFAATVALPVVFKYTTSYAAPTAAYAIQIMASGSTHSGIATFQGPGWGGAALNGEYVYPVPSVLLSIFVLVTNVPMEYTMFNFITALANFSLFVVARRVLRDTPNGLLLSAFFYLFATFSWQRYGESFSRATFGQISLNYFLLAFVLFMGAKAGVKRTRPWIIILIILTLATGLSYYTSTLAVMLLSLFMIFLLPIAMRPAKQYWRKFPGLSTATLAGFLFVYNTYVDSRLPEAALGTFFQNFLYRALTIIGMEHPMPSEGLNLLHVDLFTMITATWFVNVVDYASIAAIGYVLIAYRPRRLQDVHIVWLFSAAVFAVNLSEFAYVFYAPLSPVRFLTRYGLIVLLFILSQHTNGPLGVAKAGLGKRFKLSKAVLLAATLIVVLIASLGAMSFAWNYNVGKPFAFERVKPLADVLSINGNGVSRQNSPIIIAGDADYTANIFFISTIHGGDQNVVLDPLGEDAYTLYYSLQANSSSEFLDRMQARQMACLLLVSGPMWGDEWGWAVTLPSTKSLGNSLSIVYSGPANLFCSTTSRQDW